MHARVRREASTRVDAVELDDGDWEAAKGAWFEHGSIAAVAKALGCTEDNARKVVEEGSKGRPPLRLEARAAIALDERGTRAKRAEAARRQEALQADAQEGHMEELRLVRSNRRAALVLQHSLASLLQSANAIALTLAMDLVGPDGRPTQKALAMPLRERLALVRTVAQVAVRASDAASKGVQMERLVMGRPGLIVGHQEGGPATEDMTAEEAEQWIRIGARALERRLRKRQVLDVAPELADPPFDPDQEG